MWVGMLSTAFQCRRRDLTNPALTVRALVYAGRLYAETRAVPLPSVLKNTFCPPFQPFGPVDIADTRPFLRVHFRSPPPSARHRLHAPYSTQASSRNVFLAMTLDS